MVRRFTFEQRPERNEGASHTDMGMDCNRPREQLARGSKSQPHSSGPKRERMTGMLKNSTQASVG